MQTDIRMVRRKYMERECRAQDELAAGKTAGGKFKGGGWWVRRCRTVTHNGSRLFLSYGTAPFASTNIY